MANKVNWGIWSKKLLKNVLVVGLAGLVSVWGNSPWFLALVPVYSAVENAVKHWN